MAIVNSNGDGSVYVKTSGRNVIIGAGGETILTVSPGNVTAQALTVTGDVVSAGGLVRSYNFMNYKVLQGTYPLMTASQVTISGTAAQGNGLTLYYTKVPVINSGSLLGIAVYSEDGTIKSGSLVATVVKNGTKTGAALTMTTGSVNYTTWTKDTYTFVGGDVLQIELSATAGYLNDIDVLSCSFLARLDVEY